MTALRANSFAAIVMLLIQVCLGMWVNLYGQLPAGDRGASVGTGIGKAIWAFRARHPAAIGATVIGLLAILDAGVSGASFVGNGSNAASMNMAVAAAIAIGCYAFVLLVSGQPRAASR
jgi:hypothetical protein